VYVSIFFRLLQAEESVETLESIRFELSTRNAELQEKVVKFQEQIRELRNRSLEEPDIMRVEDITVQLDNANKHIMKLKAQHRTKVKNLTKQLDGSKQVRIVV
jgi:septal ring factor EnvC (AmiA/AmiB activator)